MTVIPELVVRDPEAARRLLCDTFDFVPDGVARVRLGDQVVALAEGAPGGHGRIDHLALSVPDLGAAAARALARGARPDMAVTPDGPQGIGEFWGAGVRYLFLQGPEGARIELIQNLGTPKGPGHDHIGIPCTDIAASMAFATGLGARLVHAVRLTRPEGATEVRFLQLGASLLELYAPPVPPVVAAPGLWRRLLIEGVTAQTGPDGLQVAPA